MNKKVLGIVIALVIVVIGGVVYLWENRTIYPNMDEKPRFFCSNVILNYYTHQDLKKYDEWKEYILNGPERKVKGNLIFTKECYEDLRSDLNYYNENTVKLKNRGVDIDSLSFEMISIFSSENVSYSSNSRMIRESLMKKYDISQDEFFDVYAKIRIELAIKYYEKLFEDLNME